MNVAHYGAVRFETVLQPVSGKAVPVLRGEVLRITQEEGEQCVDFNAFNLHDYKEYMSVSNTRSRHRFRVKKGDVVWSVHSRDRPMLAILDMPTSCVTDLLGGRCRASLFDRRGYGLHTSCQDTLAAAVGEFDLTPDDVHDSLNFWMNTEWDSTGAVWTVWNTGRKGDYVDLLAVMDTLCVPVVCGSGDVSITSNFFFKPIRLQVFGSSAETLKTAEGIERANVGFKGQRTPSDFKVAQIKPDRELTANPAYVPAFVNYPMAIKPIALDLTDEELAATERLVQQGFGHEPGDVIRRALMLWYHRNREPRASGRLRY